MKLNCKVTHVTKRTKDDKKISWHEPIDESATLRLEFDGNKVRGEIHFQGHDSIIRDIRSGYTASSVVVVRISEVDEFPYDFWELYTDIPYWK